MKKKLLTSLIAASIASFGTIGSAQAVYYFNDTAPSNDLSGSFQAEISYAQVITTPQTNDKGDLRPHLAGQRDTLLMVRPLQTLSNNSTVTVTALDQSGQRLGDITLAAPSQLPNHDNNALVTTIKYADNTWSGTLPANWMLPGLTLQITANGNTSYLNDITIGASSELWINTLDLGIFTAPRNWFHFADDINRHRDYFQKIPISKLTVNNYAPMQLSRVVFADGRTITGRDPSTGGWHTGDSRQAIVKILFSHGINMANYGLNTSDGTSEKAHPYTAVQMTGTSAVVVYSNGTVKHGGSGGNGMITIDDSRKNEWSHEVGHNYGLGHYPGGFEGSVHRPPTEINSAWGWDIFQKRFIANLQWGLSAKNQTIPNTNQSQPPFLGQYTYNTDSMASGNSRSTITDYTLHTPYALHSIQQFLENKAILDVTSPTGYRLWNENTKAMDIHSPQVPNAQQTINSRATLDLIKDDTNGEVLRSFFTGSDFISIILEDGVWISDIYAPNPTLLPDGKLLSVNRNSSWGADLHINDETIYLGNRNETLYFEVQNGSWVEVDISQVNATRDAPAPIDKGVPVTTLLGFYDPEKSINGYLYPALHGASGFIYPSISASQISDNSCYLKVSYSAKPDDYFELQNQRYSPIQMNKLHINVATADQPNRADVMCDNTVLSSRSINQPTQPLTVSVITSDSYETPIDPDIPVTNRAPSANAGNDRQSNAGETITLSASASTDPDNDALTYEWRQISGTDLNLGIQSSQLLSVTIPTTTSDSAYQFQLTVNDGELSDSDTVTIIGIAPEANQTPSVNINSSYTVEEDNTITITASANDPDGDPLTYAWNTSGLSYQFVSNNSIRVTAPQVDVDTNYSISVTVQDPELANATDIANLLVTNKVTVVDPTPGTCTVGDPAAAQYAAWSASKTYTGGNRVSHQNLVWRAKYWTRGNTPDSSAAWALESDVVLPWKSSTAYSGGAIVSFNGNQYEAAYWTLGNQPGTHSVWRNIGAACQ
ncbi:M66 family metalloprotease [Vibrio sp.]|nr:M66 family metalloprotease [Vibrio sp.]